MSNLTEQDYDGFHAVLAELNANDVVVYRTEIVPHLDELAQDERGELRERAELAFTAFYKSASPGGVRRVFNELEDWQKTAWTKAAEALNG